MHSPDPHYQLKRGYLAATHVLRDQNPSEVVLVYMDELTYYRRPSLNRAYAYKGHHQDRVRLGHKSNQRARIAACVDTLTGRVIF